MRGKMIWYGSGLPDLAALNAKSVGSMVEHVGIRFTSVTDDSLTGTMPVDGRTCQPFGLLHGGASVVLAETLASVGAFYTLDPAVSTAVGLEINANHVRPVGRGWVTGVARPEALGRTVQVWSVRITDEAGKLACVSRVTMAVISSERATPRA